MNCEKTQKILPVLSRNTILQCLSKHLLLIGNYQFLHPTLFLAIWYVQYTQINMLYFRFVEVTQIDIYIGQNFHKFYALENADFKNKLQLISCRVYSSSSKSKIHDLQKSVSRIKSCYDVKYHGAKFLLV